MSDTRFLQHHIADIRERLVPWRIDESSEAVNDNHLSQEEVVAPPLTPQARVCLLRCRHHVQEIQDLAGHRAIESAGENDPLFLAHDRCAAMAEAAVRLAQTLPGDVAIQTRLCEGLEGLVTALGDHIAELRQAADRTERVNEQHSSLTDLLTGLTSGSNLALEPFTALAEAVVTDARQGEPLRLLSVPPVSPAVDCETGRQWLAQHVAAHSLNVAHVAARTASFSRFFADQPMSLVLGALLHDAGMLTVPFEILADPFPWTADQVAMVHHHVDVGVAIIEEHLMTGGILVDAIARHHARLDGTGYPAVETESSPLAGLLAACDVYAALRTARPHRPALNSQAALTELIFLAQRGQLDADAVLAMQSLTFYPVGTVVELDDGSIGYVIAIHGEQPVVELIADGDQQRIPGRSVRNLGMNQCWSVVRSLTDNECRRWLAAHPKLL